MLSARWKFFVSKTDEEDHTGEWVLRGPEHTFSREPSPAAPTDLLVAASEHDVSRPHVTFAVGLDRVTLVDCGSRYGTFLNGAQVEACARVALDLGDVVRAGSFLLTLAPASAAVRPPRKAVMARNGTPLRPDFLLFTKGSLSGTRLRLDFGPVLIGSDRWSTVLLNSARYRGAHIAIVPAGGGGHRVVDASESPRLRVNGERVPGRPLEHKDVVELGSDVAMVYVVYRKSEACKVVAAGTAVRS